ncbi:MAG: hypothetical protein ABIR81_06740 [Ginsengibacter sp.]
MSDAKVVMIAPGATFANLAYNLNSLDENDNNESSQKDLPEIHKHNSHGNSVIKASRLPLVIYWLISAHRISAGSF